MSATVKGLTGLVFGAPVVTGVVMQNYSADRAGKLAMSIGEDGDEIGYAVHGGKAVEHSGDYTYKGNDIGTIGATVTIPDAPGTGDITLYDFGRKRTATGFCSGSFKAVSVDGVTTAAAVRKRGPQRCTTRFPKMHEPCPTFKRGTSSWQVRWRRTASVRFFRTHQ